MQLFEKCMDTALKIPLFTSCEAAWSCRTVGRKKTVTFAFFDIVASLFSDFKCFQLVFANLKFLLVLIKF